MASASTPFSPDAFKNMAQYKKHAIRQGLLPATDCEGRHSSEDISHQLAKDILDIHHTGLFQDFHNWRSINSPTMPQSQKDLDDLLQTYFNATEYELLPDCQRLQCPEISVPILQEAFCQTLHHANVSPTLTPQRGQHIPLLLGMPPSSQWPGSHDPPRTMAQHHRGIREVQDQPSA